MEYHHKPGHNQQPYNPVILPYEYHQPSHWLPQWFLYMMELWKLITMVALSTLDICGNSLDIYELRCVFSHHELTKSVNVNMVTGKLAYTEYIFYFNSEFETWNGHHISDPWLHGNCMSYVYHMSPATTERVEEIILYVISYDVRPFPPNEVPSWNRAEPV